mmetsp:Transcript_26066/g.60859  ORF Transcript_26066/g.60859 Transcript_26066/m.60859 type:complete len:377 (+) Transcript_26066:351-1481(+)
MDQQYGKVDGVVVRHDAVKAAQHAPRQAHDPVSGVVDLAGGAPPAAGEEASSALRLQVPEVGDLRRVGIAAEGILLTVGAAEDAVSQGVGGQHQQEHGEAEVRIVIDQIPRLEAVREGHPGQVAKDQHEAESVGGNVHRRQDGPFLIQRIPNVESLEGIDQHHTTTDVPKLLLLLDNHGHVEEGPADEAGTELAELLPVEGSPPRIQLPSKEEVVGGAAGIAPLGAEEGGVGGRSQVQIRRQGEAQQDGGQGQLGVIIVQQPQRGPAQLQYRRSIVNLHVRRPPDGDDQQCRPEGQVAVDAVAQPLAGHGRTLEGSALHDFARKDPFKNYLEEEPADDTARAFQKCDEAVLTSRKEDGVGQEAGQKASTFTGNVEV